MDDEIFLNERIKVLACFDKDCRPLKFVRQNNREVIVSEIGLDFPTLKSGRNIHIFDVTDGQSDYRLEFDSVSLIWRLTREADHYEI